MKRFLFGIFATFSLLLAAPASHAGVQKTGTTRCTMSDQLTHCRFYIPANFLSEGAKFLNINIKGSCVSGSTPRLIWGGYMYAITTDTGMEPFGPFISFKVGASWGISAGFNVPSVNIPNTRGFGVDIPSYYILPECIESVTLFKVT